MSLKDLLKMTDGEKQFLIAEAAGYQELRCFEDSDTGNQIWSGWLPGKTGYCKREITPNYLTSLDAMHTAIMAVTPAQRKAIRFWLYELTDQMSAHFADAPTTANAFILAVCQWNN